MKRIALLITGAGLLAAGAYGGWIVRDAASSLLAPPAGSAAWLLVAALFAACCGLVLMFTSVRVSFDSASTARAGKDSQRRATSDAATAPTSVAQSDWRSGPLPPGPSVDVLFDTDQPDRTVSDSDMNSAGAPSFADHAPATTREGAANSVIGGQSSPFPSKANIGAMPTAQFSGETATTSQNVQAGSTAADAFTRIREAIRDGAFDHAAQMLTDERSRLSALGEPARLAMAELITIDGDLHDATGQTERAQWLWRLSLKRFTEAGAASAPLARMLAEKVGPEPA